MMFIFTMFKRQRPHLPRAAETVPSQDLLQHSSRPGANQYLIEIICERHSHQFHFFNTTEADSRKMLYWLTGMGLFTMVFPSEDWVAQIGSDI